MTWRWFKKGTSKYDHEIDPHEILLDAKNLPSFDTQQFEGVIERPIRKRVIVTCGIISALIGISITAKLLHLQIAQGEEFFTRSENNRLHNIPIFGERGVIYDRNGTELAWNSIGTKTQEFPERKYTSDPGFSHILGYVGYPTKDKSGFYWRTNYEAKAGIEKKYDTRLSSTNGIRLVETDAYMNITSENTIQPPVPGQNIYLTLDARMQKKMYGYLSETAQEFGYQGGAGIIMDVENGDLVAMASYPEYNSNAMTSGDTEYITEALNDKNKPFLDRAVSGLYTPGSTIKPYIALGALTEGVITTKTSITSIGTIEVPNPYTPEKPSIFRDWRPGGHGVTDIYHAIADSVNTYFYAIGGGYKHIEGIGIENIGKYVRLFGFGEKTNIDVDGEGISTIPNPEWKERTFKGEPWRLGDTYNSSIGQYGFRFSPIQVVRAVGALATKGILVTPHVERNSSNVQKKTISEIPTEHFETIHKAMRQTVTDGTAGLLNVPYVTVAAKTGTAQVGAGNEFENSWSTGFFPYEHPRYAFVIVMERGPSAGSGSASSVMRKLFDHMENEIPGYFDDIAKE